MSNDPLQAAGIILFRRGGHGVEGVEYLLLRNAKHRTWGFAKGHAEPGETPEETARREVREETGLDRFRMLDGFCEKIQYELAHRDGLRRKRVTYYLAEVRDEEVERSSEHDAIAWATRRAALEMLAHENLRSAFERAAACVERFLDAKPGR